MRNDAAKDKLRQRLKNSIIMSVLVFLRRFLDLTYAHRTLYESKGLEFNDVSLTPLHFHLLPTNPRSCCTTSSGIPQQL